MQQDELTDIGGICLPAGAPTGAAWAR